LQNNPTIPCPGGLRAASRFNPLPDGAMMQMDDASGPAASLSLHAAASLQDDLLTATNDLERLQTLLADACATLAEGFYGATEQIRAASELHEQAEAVVASVNFERAMEHLRAAVTALQFQDMASQLIAHTNRRLRVCADRLARDAFADDEGDAEVEDLPLRPNPVTQAEMDAGSIELF
jgi:hypothetical protein